MDFIFEKSDFFVISCHFLSFLSFLSSFVKIGLSTFEGYKIYGHITHDYEGCIKVENNSKGPNITFCHFWNFCHSWNFWKSMFL